MNQQTANSSFTNNSHAASTLSPAVTPAADTAAPAKTPPTQAVVPKSQSPAKANARKAALTNKNDDRCRHYTVAGRRCRHTVLDRASGLCFRHMGRSFQPTDEDLSPAFAGLLSGFESATRIHDFLTQLTVLLVQNRISTRRAAILAYLGNMLLRTRHAADLEDAKPQSFIFDLPRPKRD